MASENRALKQTINGHSNQTAVLTSCSKRFFSWEKHDILFSWCAYLRRVPKCVGLLKKKKRLKQTNFYSS